MVPTLIKIIYSLTPNVLLSETVSYTPEDKFFKILGVFTEFYSYVFAEPHTNCDFDECGQDKNADKIFIL